MIKRGLGEKRWLGGEMELNPELLYASPNTGASWHFDCCQTVTSGRTGIRLAAQTLKAASNGIVLLPAYLCASMLQPFREEGIPTGFYRIRADLSIDLNHLADLVESARPCGVLFVNYFGFPVRQAEAETLRQIRSRCLVIEDCSHGSLVETENPIVGGIGDFVVTSFRKYLPVPDGGLVVNKTNMSLPALPPASGRFTRWRLLGKFLRYEVLHESGNQTEFEDAYLALFSSAEEELDKEVPLKAMSQISEDLLSVTDLAAVIRQRRRNYSVLLRAFTETPELRFVGTPMLAELPDGVSPLIFPIKVADGRRDALRHQLMSRRVFCPIHWNLPSQIEEDNFPESYQLSRHILGLPVDQRYDEDDMLCLIDRLLQGWGESV
jgi:dTDP-4-amino-4,6-dideoxygalactose transaminase